MSNYQFFDTDRSLKLFILFFIMIFMVAAFLMGIDSILNSNRHLPPAKAALYNRALRGSIISDDNFTIAKSNKKYQAKIYPFSLDPQKEELFIKLFSIYSKIEPEKIREKIYTKDGKKKKGYVTLSSNIDATTAIYLKALSKKLRRLKVFRAVTNSKGVSIYYGLDILEKGEVREYPFGDTLTPAIGYIRAKALDKYQEIIGVKGLERWYERYLSKKINGLVMGKRDVTGTIIRSKSSINIKREDGFNLHLNILMDLQKRVELALDNMKKKVKAKEIIAAVMDSKTGKILAIASSNRYNPNHITKEDIPKLQAKFTEYLYEPGSVIKPITLSIALENSYVNINTIINTHNGVLPLTKKYKIKDDEPFTQLSATDIIVHSSNIGISEIAWRIDTEIFYKGLKSFGLGEASGVDLPRDLKGKIKSLKLLKNRIDKANQSYGYGMQLTFMQLLKAYSVFNNEGVEVTPKIVNYLESSNGKKFLLKSSQKQRRVLSKKVTKKMKSILIEVVKRGTGKAARYEGLEIGGKTGTAHIYDFKAKSYVERYNSSFFGFVNDDKGDKYTIGVLAIEPTRENKHYFASKSAVPTFRKIVDSLVELGYLKPKLSPNKLEEFEKQKEQKERLIKQKQEQRTKKIKELLKRQREELFNNKKSNTLPQNPSSQPPKDTKKLTPQDIPDGLF